MRSLSENYEHNVFINCPFDDEYKPIFNSIVFTIHDLGFIPRCALELENAAQNRLEKIITIIEQCKYGIHDISRTELSPNSRLPRFNMPFELGLYLGCRRFGTGHHQDKCCLILDREMYRYQHFISDISGQDIQSHQNTPQIAITKIRNWLRSNSTKNMRGGEIIYERYINFTNFLPAICDELNIDRPVNLPFVDFSHVVTVWLETIN